MNTAGGGGRHSWPSFSRGGQGRVGRGGQAKGQEAEGSGAGSGLQRGAEKALGLGGLTLLPHALLISLTPAGEASARGGAGGAARDLGSLGWPGLPCCRPVLPAAGGCSRACLGSLWSEGLWSLPPGQGPRAWRPGEGQLRPAPNLGTPRLRMGGGDGRRRELKIQLCLMGRGRKGQDLFHGVV